MRYLRILLLIPALAWADIDTLKDTSEVYDCMIYGYTDCDAEGGGNCKRYNSGRVTSVGIGNFGTKSYPRRGLFMLPGWNDTLPDSSEFKIYCFAEGSVSDYIAIIYPVTTQWYEGEEADYGVGNYPDPDSGATWLHAYLDVGDADSVKWDAALGGGDYTTGIACSTTITGTGSYFTFENFNRILNYWDTSGVNYGFILVIAGAAVSNYKAFRSSERSTNFPLAILFYPDAEDEGIPNVRHGPEGSGQRHGPDGSSVRHGP